MFIVALLLRLFTELDARAIRAHEANSNQRN
jgi:hypothetical protein